MKKVENKLQLKTFEEVFNKASKSKTFQKEYNEEIIRLRLASEVKNLRTKQGLTQQTLAKRAKMPQSVIARLESGNHSISLGTLNRIAQVFGKKVQLV